MCRPGAKKMVISSRPWTHSRWMVTSMPASGSLLSTRPRQKNGPASWSVLVGAGTAANACVIDSSLQNGST